MKTWWTKRIKEQKKFRKRGWKGEDKVRKAKQANFNAIRQRRGREFQLQLHYTLVLWMNSSMNNLWPTNKNFHFIFYNICQKHVHSFNSMTLSQKAYLI